MQTPQTEERRPERFAAYIAARRFDPPRPLLIRAAGLAESKDHALDAGAGALNTTRYLLSVGFKHVTALDSSPASQTVAAELHGNMVTALRVGLEGLAVIGHPFHRPLQPARRPGRQRLLGVDDLLAAKPAAVKGPKC